MSPRSFAPAEYDNIDRRHDGYTDELQHADRKDRMLRPVIGVVHDVHNERYHPHHHVDARVDEEKSELTLNGTPAELHCFACS